jgi:hypothetical protein
MDAWGDTTRDEYEDETSSEPLTTVTFLAIRTDSSEDESEVRNEKGQTRFERLELLVDAALQLPATADPEQPVTLTSPQGREFSLIGAALSGAPVGSKRLHLRTGGVDAALYL